MRNSFLTPLIVEVMPSGKRFKLHYDFTYRVAKAKVNIRVPAGFETDFASIPVKVALAVSVVCLVVSHYLSLSWLFWIGLVIVVLVALIPKFGRYNKAGVLHDWLYSSKAYQTPSFVPRKLADLIFLDAMTDLGVAKWKRTLMYYGVRAFGFLAWRKR